MSTDLIPFDFHGRQVRAVVVDGEPLVHHADACRVLEHSNPSMAIRLVDDEDKRKIDLRAISASQHALSSAEGVNTEAWFITESGLYALVFASKVKEARTFRRWVTHEVLPAIRKTGRYEVQQAEPVLDELEIAERYVAALKRSRALEARNAELEPAAKAWTVLASGDGDYSVADAAKILSRDPNIKLGRDRLFTLLREYGWLYRQQGDTRHRAYQTAVDTGRLSELPSSHYHPRTGVLVLDPPQVRVTLKGLQELHKRLGGVSPLDLFDPPGGAA